MVQRANGPPPTIHYRTAELRAAPDGAGFSGYASHFWSVDSYYTAVKPGAFKKTIAERGEKTPLLWQHNPDWPIGKPTLLKEDKTGLRFDAAVSEATATGRDVMALLRDGVPLGMSFGFQTLRSRPATEDDPLVFGEFVAKTNDIEVIEEVRLWEISAVTFAANEAATITHVRRVAEADAVSSLIAHLRAGSLSRDQDALIAELVAAWSARAGAGSVTADHSTPEPARRRPIDVDLLLMEIEFAGLLPAGV